MFNDSTRLIFKTIFHTAFFQTSCPRQYKKRKNFYFERLTPKRDFSISLTISNHGWTGISKSTFTQNSYSLTYTVRLCSNEFKSCEPKYAIFAKRGHSQNSRYILTLNFRCQDCSKTSSQLVSPTSSCSIELQLRLD